MGDGLNRELSSRSNRDRPGQRRSNTNVSDLEGQDELFMTISSEEEKEWAAMMKNKRDQMLQNIEEYKKWTDAFTRRRMFACSRIRKLNIANRDRMKFVSKMAGVVKNANDKLQDASSNSSTDEEKTQSSDGDSSQRVTFDVGHVETDNASGGNETNDENNNDTAQEAEDGVKKDGVENDGQLLKENEDTKSEKETKVS